MSSGEADIAEQVERVVEVTACTAEEAKHYLAACSNDVEAAVALFFEQGSSGVPSAENVAGPSLPSLEDDDEVRAPIAPVREQLIQPEDDNFFASGQSSTSANRLSRVSQRIRTCPLRDFARESALLEEQMMGYSDPSAFRLRRERSAQILVAGQSMALQNRPNSASGASRLGDLFRPPTDILYTGSLIAAREFSTKRQRWLLVNVQSDNFRSQTMNRDVWSDKELKKLIRRQFTFWQVDDDTAEGRRFVAFYHCSKLPYLCIIDPRTGEEVWRSVDPNQENVLPNLREFLRDHRDFSLEEDAPSTSKRAAIHLDDDDDDDGDNGDGEASCSSSADSAQRLPKKRTKIMELTEEEQLSLAIKNSMNENGNNNGGSNEGTTKTAASSSTTTTTTADVNGSDCESLEEFDDDDVKVNAPAATTAAAAVEVNYEEQLGEAKNELTMLKLRLLNATGAEEVVQLRWPSDTKLKTMRLFIRQSYKHIPLEGYKLICAFPRKSLEAEHNEDTLKELGLHPSANVHLTLDE